MGRFRKRVRFKVWFVDHDGQTRMEKLQQTPTAHALIRRRGSRDVYVVRRRSNTWEVLDFTASAGALQIFEHKERQTATAWAAMRAALIGRKDT